MPPPNVLAQDHTMLSALQDLRWEIQGDLQVHRETQINWLQILVGQRNGVSNMSQSRKACFDIVVVAVRSRMRSIIRDRTVSNSPETGAPNAPNGMSSTVLQT